MFTLSCSGGWVPGSYAEKIRAAAALGYKAVEPLCWLREDIESARAAIDETGCAISAILVQSADEAQAKLICNEHGIVHEDAKEAFARAIGETLEAALALNCGTIVVTSGNERSDVSREVQHANIVEALRAALPVIAGSGVQLALEPLNTLVNHKGYYLTTSEECAEIVREVNSPQVKMLYDVYHQQITEGNLIDNIRRYINEIGHFHVGDVPGRNEPGTGEINYKNVFKAIAGTGYAGYVVFECGMTEPVEVVTRKMFELLPE
ncbi:MAG: TIM barrel protein [Oscillospiraceae bacterium]|nr:TIM barrel protein [Oscillospiraceae bacterium]